MEKAFEQRLGGIGSAWPSSKFSRFGFVRVYAIFFIENGGFHSVWQYVRPSAVVYSDQYYGEHIMVLSCECCDAFWLILSRSSRINGAFKLPVAIISVLVKRKIIPAEGLMDSTFLRNVPAQSESEFPVI
jgi:hypothetical protein